ncbi:MAG: hypothetical protein LUI60_04955 [Clostridia bacterium]|nr:hypothetical protein [Clostridia bacterium]
MFKQEFKKIFKTGIMPAIIAVLAVLIILLCVGFAQTFTFGNRYRAYGISEYQSQEELLALITETEENIESLEYSLETDWLSDEDYTELENRIDRQKLRLNVYNYLYEKGISYSDYNDYGGIRAQTKDNAFCAFTWLMQICSFALPLAMGFAAAVLMPADFHSGTYKYLYSSSVPRKKFIWTRYLVWLACVAGISLIVCAACAFLGLMYGSASGVIVYATSSSAFGLNYIGTVALESLSALIKVLTYGTIVFGSSMLARNVVLPVTVNIVLGAGSAGLSIYCASEGHPLLYLISNGITGAYSFTGYGSFPVASTLTIFLSVLILVIAAIAVFAAGYMRLNYRNIY